MQEKFLVTIGVLTAVISLMILLLKNFRQPNLIAYTLAGFLLGPYMLGVIESSRQIEAIGEAGVLLYMLFLGIELKWPGNIRFMWKPVLFQLIKSLISFTASFVSILVFHLSITTAVVLAFVLMLNSTSVASEYLRKNQAHQTAFGTLILSVLIIQDIAFAPLLSSLRFLGNQSVDVRKLGEVVVATAFITWLILRVSNLRELKLPWEKGIKNDHDLQLFLGLMICFGLSLLTGAMGLSTSLGAFVSGILLKKVQAFDWIEHTLRPFKTFFMAMFFVYLGLTFDLNYFKANLTLILILVGFLVIFQNVFSALSFRVLGYRWSDSIYAGALLSNIGELSLVICLLAAQLKLIDAGILKLVISVTILSILFTTIWTTIIRTSIGLLKRPMV